MVAALLAYPAVALSAMNCQVTVTPFNFGNYLPGDAAPLDITGRIDVRCTGEDGQFLGDVVGGWQRELRATADGFRA